jgi:hypothetical protein
MDLKPYEKMIELASRAKEKGVSIVLRFVPNEPSIDEDDADVDPDDERLFEAVVTNSDDAELVTALTTHLVKDDEEEID